MPSQSETLPSETAKTTSATKARQSPKLEPTRDKRKDQQPTVSSGDVSEEETADGDDSTPSFEEILQSLADRFIRCLGEEELASSEVIKVQIEKAHRVYEENVRPQNPSLPSLPPAKFSELFLQQAKLAKRELPPAAQPPGRQETVSLWDILEKLKAAPEELARPAEDQDANTIAVAADLGDIISNYGKPKKQQKRPQPQPQPQQAEPQQRQSPDGKTEGVLSDSAGPSKPMPSQKRPQQRRAESQEQQTPDDTADGTASGSVSQSEPPRTPATPPMQPAKQSDGRPTKPRRERDENNADLMERMQKVMMKDEDKQALLDNRAERFNMLTNNPATQLAQNKKGGGEYGYEGGGGSNQAPPLIVATVNAYVYAEVKVNANVTINICAPATEAAKPPKWAD